MAATDTDGPGMSGRGAGLRLRTLVLLRWFAIGGQVLAVIVASLLFDLTIEISLAALAIAASVAANLLSSTFYPEAKRLTAVEAEAMLSFDILQLGALLAVTGGLNNPFALLLLAPATIAATILPLRATIMLAAVTVLAVTGAALWHLPISLDDGAELLLPDLFRFGFWLALIVGVLFLAIYARQVTTETHRMSEALLAAELALARAQTLTDLGGVVAATAHELGTPLATIKLVSTELVGELKGQPDLEQDARLIRDQADRCRDILRSMGRAGKDDLLLRSAPVEAVVREAAEPHKDRNKAILITALPDDPASDSRQPHILRRPEVIHGLRNLIQNATDFARTTVTVDASWTSRAVVIRIEDDGPGFPPTLLPRIGDPFMRRRRWIEETRERPGYEGMGLGLFIAKTLLERTGASLGFANSGDHGGAIVIVEWPRPRIEAPVAEPDEGLGDNVPFRA
jgi:two-component system, sensor histidine kinase RegB